MAKVPRLGLRPWGLVLPFVMVGIVLFTGWKGGQMVYRDGWLRSIRLNRWPAPEWIPHTKRLGKMATARVFKCIRAGLTSPTRSLAFGRAIAFDSVNSGRSETPVKLQRLGES
jgi:hypothetical protein